MVLQNFIVLGWIPGTQVQITFQIWMQLIAILVATLVGLYIIHRRSSISIAILNVYVRRAVREQQLSLSF